MTTISKLAAEHNALPHQLAALLGLGTDYEAHAELDDATEADYRDIIAFGYVTDVEREQ